MGPAAGRVSVRQRTGRGPGLVHDLPLPWHGGGPRRLRATRTPPIAANAMEQPMKIQLNTDVHIEGTEALAAWVGSTLEQALARFADSLSRVEVHLSDENGGKGGPQDHRCLLEARPEGRQPMVVTAHGATLEQALQAAVHKLVRRLGSTLGRLQDHRSEPAGVSAAPNPATTAPEAG
jgi:ribosome-associated translation inhibitor RaiA